MNSNSEIIENLISVIVPIYNVEKYVGTCIESILSQTYLKLQIILVDDGSTDRSGEICDYYAQIDGRINVIHKKNGGVSSARKIGLCQAKGEYIGFVDGDDYVDNEMYQELFRIVKKYDADFVHMGYYLNDQKTIKGLPDKELRVIHDGKKGKYQAILYLLSMDDECGIAPSICTKLFRNKIIKEAHEKVLDGQNLGEDLVASCKCILECNSFVIFPKAYYHYRIRSDSITHKISIYRIIEYSKLFLHLECILREQDGFETLIERLERRTYGLILDGIAGLNNIYIPKYEYHNIKFLFGKKVILYGAGRVGKDYYQQICRYRQCNIVGWVDQTKQKIDYFNIISKEEIININFDLIIIAVKDANVAKEIKDDLILIGIDATKISWDEPMPLWG